MLREIQKKLHDNICLKSTKVGLTDVRHHCEFLLAKENVSLAEWIKINWNTPFKITILLMSLKDGVISKDKAPTIKDNKSEFVTKRDMTNTDEFVITIHFSDLNENENTGDKYLVKKKGVA